MKEFVLTKKTISTSLLAGVLFLGACSTSKKVEQDGIVITSSNYKPSTTPPPEPQRPTLASSPDANVVSNGVQQTSVQEAMKTLLGSVNAPGRESWTNIPSPPKPPSADSIKDRTKVAVESQPRIERAPRARVSVSSLGNPQTVEPSRERASANLPSFDPTKTKSPAASPLPSFDPTKQ